MKPDFSRAEEAARLLRLSQPSCSLKCDIREAKFDRQIIIDTFQNYARITGVSAQSLAPTDGLKDGYLIKRGGLSIILYDGYFPFGFEHAMWTITHEVGHVYLGHQTDGHKEEIEAHWFAAEYLSPEPIIREFATRLSQYNIPVKAHDLMFLFPLSREAAIKRISSINRKYGWNTLYAEQLVNKYSVELTKYCSLIQTAYATKMVKSNNLERVLL